MSASGLESCLLIAESALHDTLDETGHSLNCVCSICQHVQSALLDVSMAESNDLDDEEASASEVDE